jgi:hypothetical protein
MSRNIRYKLSGERFDIALKFANDLGLSLDEAAKRALFLVIRQAYAQGEAELQKEINAHAARDSGAASGLAGGGAALANEADLAPAVLGT